MTLPVEMTIAGLLFTHLSDFADEQSPALAVSFPDINFEPPDGEAYIEATFLPNTTTSFAVSSAGSNRYVGLMQATVMWPSRGVGELIPALELAGRIGRHFGRGLRLVEEYTVRVPSEPSIAPPLYEPGRIRVPVTVAYLCFAKPPAEVSAVPAGAWKWKDKLMLWKGKVITWRP